MLLLLKYWKVGAALVLVAALISGYAYWHHHVYASGKAEIQAKWDKDTAARDAVTAQAQAKASADRAITVAHNIEVLSDYNEQLLAAAGERDSYYRLLQQARGQVRAVTANESTSTLVTAQTREADRAAEIDRAIAGVLVESRQNADQLDALIAVVKPQL